MENLLMIGLLTSCITTLLLTFTYLAGFLASRRSYIGIWTFSWFLMAISTFLQIIPYNINHIWILISLIAVSLFVQGIWVYIKGALANSIRLMITGGTLFLFFICTIFSPSCLLPLNCFILGVGYCFIGILLFQNKVTPYEYAVSILFIIWGLHSFIFVFLSSENMMAIWYLIGSFIKILVGPGLLLIYFHFVKRQNLDTEHKLEAMFHSSFQFVFLLDLEGRILRANKTVLESMDDVSGNLFWDTPWWIHSDIARDEVKSAVNRALEGKFVRFETTIKEKDGELKFIDFSITPFFDDEGNLIYLIPEGRDITELVSLQEEKIRVEKELYQASKMEAIGTLAGGIAHDFNNVLAAILGNAELMRYQMKDGDEFSESVNQIIKAGNRAKDLVKQILTFSRTTDHKMDVVRIDTSVKETVKLLRSFIPSSVKISQNICSDIKPIQADLTYIHQIVTNLATNASHAMDEKGRLNITLENLDIAGELAANLGVSGEYVHLSVSDTGTGMSDEVKSRIFDPFYTTKEVGKGTGLGLSVIHGIVKEMNGLIEVDTHLGEGTTFHIYFPIKKAQIVEEAEESVVIAPSCAEKIMLVDDDQMVADVAKGMLSLLGYSVKVFTDSVEALETFVSNPKAFDLVITDQIMPNMTGDELVKEILSLRHDIPVVMATGYSNKITEAKAKEIGAKQFLMKPFKINALASAVRDCLCAA